MRKVLFIAILGLGISSCSSKWQYKTVSVKGNEDASADKFQSKKFDVTDEALDLFGKEGWELVGIYEKTETVHPNFGNDQYVSGIQPNVRTAELNFVFKRKK
ncbi:MAG: DUF4177 domain-containing protein [Pseudobacter sp.]|uniref:DUF4177 domain-containing protein n=1 Tax=Pseudobacter sp. TaxID=2045420 RepID=UPI003F822439